MSRWRGMAGIMLLVASVPILALSQEHRLESGGSEVRVIRDVVTTGIVNREPIDGPAVFPPSVGVLYYFTEVESARTPAQIVHRWYFQGENVAEVSLPVEADRWRTWSRKQILRNWTGSWKGEAVDGSGKVLSSRSFDVH